MRSIDQRRRDRSFHATIRRRAIVAVTLAVAGAGCGIVDDNPTVATETSVGTGPTSSSDITSSAVPDTVATITVEQIPGDPADGGPSALDDMNDDAFPPPLVDPAAIRSGGPPPDGIPPIDEPRFERASDVSWIDDVEPVLALEVDGEIRAYPVQVMTWHEIVNDTFGDTPVTVSYCPLCNSAIAYLRRLDGRTLDFGTSGMLFNSSLVMYDRQTESLWSHFTGEAVVGSLTGAQLETLPVATVSWAAFQDAHPDALVLSRDTGFNRDYGRNPYPGYDDVNEQPFLFDGEVDGRLPAQARVVAIRGETESVVIVLDDLVAAGVIEVSVDGEALVAIHQPGTASALDTATIAGGRDVGAVGVFGVEGIDALSLERGDDGTIVDAASGSTLDILGRFVDGERNGSSLERIEHLDTFWFAIAAFEPDTRIG